MFGAEHSQKIKRNLSNIEAMISRLEVLQFDNNAAYHFGQVRAELYQEEQPIGPYDMMLAGQVRALGLTLVTINVKELGQLPDIILEHWTTPQQTQQEANPLRIIKQ